MHKPIWFVYIKCVYYVDRTLKKKTATYIYIYIYLQANIKKCFFHPLTFHPFLSLYVQVQLRPFQKLCEGLRTRVA